MPGVNVEEKSNVSGSTPATVIGLWSMLIVRPTIAGSAAKRRAQNAWLMSIARGPFGVSSSRVNDRPSAGWTPSTSKKRGATSTPTTRSGSPRPVSVLLP